MKGTEAATITFHVNRLVCLIAKHWLLVVNAALAIQAILPVLPPILMVTGHASAARVLYYLFQPVCHQLPERSFFLFGLQPFYRYEELQRLVGSDVGLRYIGSPELGYKMAVCQRDAATFAALSLAGLTFALLRKRPKPLSLRAFVLCCVPMAVDGFGQLIGQWESTWWSRVISGGLFGLACVWLAFPYVAQGMQSVLDTCAPAPRHR